MCTWVFGCVDFRKIGFGCVHFSRAVYIFREMCTFFEKTVHIPRNPSKCVKTRELYTFGDTSQRCVLTIGHVGYTHPQHHKDTNQPRCVYHVDLWLYTAVTAVTACRQKPNPVRDSSAGSSARGSTSPLGMRSWFESFYDAVCTGGAGWPKV